MGYVQTQTPNLANTTTPHLYSQAIQLKLYQAFIFSIPILFSIILILLFYLFYLKRRSFTSSPPPILPRTSNQARSSSLSVNQMGEVIDLKKNFEDKLLVVLFDEELGTKDSQCCVCLGEFEIKEKLQQIPSCKHVFHADCIRHWLNSNSTCPLCRCSVTMIAATINKDGHPTPPTASDMGNHAMNNSNFNTRSVSTEHQEEVSGRVDMGLPICSGDHHNLYEGSSSTSASMSVDNKTSHHNVKESHVLSIGSNP